jgi:hypothetical protein
MVSGCAAAGYSSVAFKPHPSAPDSLRMALQSVADARLRRFSPTMTKAISATSNVDG